MFGISIIIITLVIGGLALYFVTERDKKRKIYFESEATERFSNCLSKTSDDLNTYNFYSLNGGLFLPDRWVLVCKDGIAQQIKASCRFSEGGSVKAQFCLYISEQEKQIYCVIGKNKYDFSKIE